MEIIQFEHHGKLVSGFAELKGKHREHCLCWQGCKHFKPDTPENCQIARVNYSMDICYNLVTPVFECPQFELED